MIDTEKRVRPPRIKDFEEWDPRDGQPHPHGEWDTIRKGLFYAVHELEAELNEMRRIKNRITHELEYARKTGLDLEAITIDFDLAFDVGKDLLQPQMVAYLKEQQRANTPVGGRVKRFQSIRGTGGMKGKAIDQGFDFFDKLMRRSPRPGTIKQEITKR